MNLRFRWGLLILVLLAASFALPQDQSPPQEKTAVVFGQNIRYFEAGQGPAVISNCGGRSWKSLTIYRRVLRLKVATEIEGPDVVPTVIFPEAWDSAMIIDQEVYKCMAEHGFKRVKGASKMMAAIAELVQFAINKSYARIVAEIEADEAKVESSLASK